MKSGVHSQGATSLHRYGCGRRIMLGIASHARETDNSMPRYTGSRSLRRVATRTHAHSWLAGRPGGDGGMEALRVLKRRLSDVVFRAMIADQSSLMDVAA